ncbi:MAG: winged helix-turn-helix transcriptional regulator [Clostridiaceae bacterium]|nr:winged helix-turn-helix transcriptional regulator [Clostridiaceae bacterium]
MTQRETEILKLIEKDPLLSQREIAELLGITRSSVAVHISNLMKKGLIVGKGYITNSKSYATVVGGVNVDIQGFPYQELIPADSNPGTVKVSLGGVGRNIAENMARLGITVKLISAIGNDIYGKKIQDECRMNSIDFSESLYLEGGSTSTYLSILDETGDMVMAIAQMDIFDRISVEFIKSKEQIIQKSQLLVLDTNIPQKIIEFLVTTYKNVDYFLDTVSTTKAKKAKHLIGYFHTIKPNRLEAEILSGREINGREDLIYASEYFLEQGVKNVFISLGKDGVFYNNGESRGFAQGAPIKVVNATGGGDAFIAALAYAYINKAGIEESARMGIAASMLAISHENTINPNMSEENLKLFMEDVHNVS